MVVKNFQFICEVVLNCRKNEESLTNDACFVMENIEVNSKKFDHVSVGDHLIRSIGGKIKMTVKVTLVTEDKIHCGAWVFDKKTGAEIDEDLEWGPHVTGSYLFENDPK